MTNRKYLYAIRIKTVKRIKHFWGLLLPTALAVAVVCLIIVLPDINVSAAAKTALASETPAAPAESVRGAGCVSAQACFDLQAMLKKGVNVPFLAALVLPAFGMAATALEGAVPYPFVSALNGERETDKLKVNLGHGKNAFTYIEVWNKYKETDGNDTPVGNYDGCFGAGVFRNIASGPGVTRTEGLLFTGAVPKPSTQ